jgi:hypothetical protein
MFIIATIKAPTCSSTEVIMAKLVEILLGIYLGIARKKTDRVEAAYSWGM